jgi:hypothetical protein
MSKILTQKDWILISAYLDEKSTPAEVSKIENRIAADPEFKKSIDEMAYTRRMLRALPAKRAPRNFTISASPEKIPARSPWLQPAMSFVSIAATVALVVIFAGSYLFSKNQVAAPMAGAPQVAIESAAKEGVFSSPPVIINWNPVLGMGGGGGSPDEVGTYLGGTGGGPVLTQPIPDGFELTPSPEPTPYVLNTPQSTQRTLAQDNSTAGNDPNNMILGLPDESVQGSVLTTETLRESIPTTPLTTRTILMIISGVIAVLSGALALILRRR